MAALLTILSNDVQRSAGDIAALYRKRWQIELLFRWIKQHLKIRAFLGRSEKAIRLQLFAAMIAYLLLRIAAHNSGSRLLALPFADLVRTKLFERRPVATIDTPHRDRVLMLTTNSISPTLDCPRTALRARGEHEIDLDRLLNSTGSSPRPRGTLRATDWPATNFRFIPASAGNTLLANA